MYIIFNMYQMKNEIDLCVRDATCHLAYSECMMWMDSWQISQLICFFNSAAALVVAMLVLAAGFNLMCFQPCDLTHISKGEINKNEGKNN